MTEPLEIRRRPRPQQLRRLLLAVSPGAFGLLVVLFGVSLTLGSTGTASQVNGWGLVAVGAGLVLYAGREGWRLRRLMARNLVLRLDDQGVHLVTGSVFGPSRVSLTWDQLEVIALVPVPAAARKQGLTSAVLFVPVAQVSFPAVSEDRFVQMMARQLGITPDRAATALGETRSGDRVPRILRWLDIHRPDVRVVDNRQGA